MIGFKKHDSYEEVIRCLALPSLEQLYQQMEFTTLSQIMTRTNDIGLEDIQEWEEILLKYQL